MDTVLTATTLTLAIVGLCILSYALVILLDQTRNLSSENQATWSSRFYQSVMMCCTLFFGALAALSLLDEEKWASLIFLIFVGVALAALIPALFRKQYWDDRKIVIEWPFGRRTEIPWDRISCARATNFPDRILFTLIDSSKISLWTEHHYGLTSLVDKLHEKLGDQFSVGMLSNLYGYYQDRFGQPK